MRARLAAALLGSSAIVLGVQPALAQDSSDQHMYFGIRGGVGFAEKSELDGRGSDLLGHSDHKTGWGVGLAVGYNFGDVRLEGELSRFQNSVDDYGFTNAGGYPFGVGTVDADRGSTRATNLMANLYYDINLGMALKPYIGFGLGGSRLNFNNYTSGATAFLDDSKTVFAYQGIAGLRYELSDRLDMTLDYRYFNTENPGLVDSLGRQLQGDYTNHLVMVGLSWKFGQKSQPRVEREPVRTAVQQEPAPQPEPQPEPEPAPYVPPPLPDPFMVNFAFDSADITSEAAAVLDRAAAAAKDAAPVRIVLKGHADTAGPNAYNQRLSERRAEAVRRALIERGINGDEIGYETEAFGEDRPLVDTGDGVAEARNRRVEISFTR